jgi:hypothetical protein
MTTDATNITDTSEPASDARVWAGEGWTARVRKNEDDEGWAVTMTRDGDAEPVLTSPWTMGRDKKNPKPLNTTDFKTLLKGARDVLTRHEAHARAQRHRSVTVQDDAGAAVRVDLDIAADEDDPHALLSAWAADGERLAEHRVEAGFKLNAASARRWVAGGFRDA